MSSASIGEGVITQPGHLTLLTPLEQSTVDDIPSGPFHARAIDFVRFATGNKAADDVIHDDVVTLGDTLVEDLAELPDRLSGVAEFPLEFKMFMRGMGDDDMLAVLGREQVYKNAKALGDRRRRLIEVLHKNGFGPVEIESRLTNIVTARQTPPASLIDTVQLPEEVPTDYLHEPFLVAVPDVRTPLNEVETPEVSAEVTTPEAEPELRVLIELQKTSYEPDIAELIIDALQRDGQPRHRKNHLDAIDIAQAHGVRDKLVRSIYDRLVRAGQMNQTPRPLPLARENGQKTAHYHTKTLYVLLPEVAAEAERHHRQLQTK